MPASACLPCLCSASLSKQLAAPDPHKPSDHPCLDMCPSCLMSNEHYAVCICPEPSSSLLSLIPGPQLLWNHTPGPLLPHRSQGKTEILPSLCTLCIVQCQCWSKDSKAGRVGDKAGPCLFCTDSCCDKISWKTGGPDPSTYFLPVTKGFSGQIVHLEAKYKNNEI